MQIQAHEVLKLKHSESGKRIFSFNPEVSEVLTVLK